MAQIALDVRGGHPLLTRLIETARAQRARAAQFRMVRRLVAERAAGRETGARI
jgi:hypothetical protein